VSIQNIVAGAARGVDCDQDAAWAVAYVESSLGRHLRRFEPHLFRRETGARAGSYAEAVKINDEAAARCCSIGVFQVLGRWHQQLGYPTAQAMMRALMNPENDAAQAASFVGYCMTVEPQAGSALRAGDLSRFAILYNGPKAIERGYDGKLRAAVRKAGGEVTEVIRLGSTGDAVARLQMLLRNEHGFADLKVDSWFGDSTEQAVRALQGRLGLTVDGIVGRKTWEAMKARGSEFAVQPKRSLMEKAEDFVRQRPGRSLTIFTTASTIAGNMGLSGVARFFDSLAIGDWGAAGSTLLEFLPWLIAAAVAAIGLWIIWTAVKIYRDQRAVAASLQPERNPENGNLYRAERIKPDHHRAERGTDHSEAEWLWRSGGGSGHAGDADRDITGWAGSDAGRIPHADDQQESPGAGAAGSPSDGSAARALALFGRG